MKHHETHKKHQKRRVKVQVSPRLTQSTPAQPRPKVPLIASLGFEPTALGVCQATKAVLQFHHEGKAELGSWEVVHQLDMAPIGSAWCAPMFFFHQ